MNNIVSLCLRYFPFPGRAGAIRDTLHIGGVTFEDVHVSYEQFRELKSNNELPFGALPVLDVETTSGHMRVAQSNAILRFAGRMSGLYPVDDEVQALKIDEALDMCEETYEVLSPSLHEADMERKMAMRLILAEETLPRWTADFERLLVSNGSTGFVVGDSLTVADLKLYWFCDFLTSGDLDGVPTSLLDEFKTVIAWYKNIDAVRKDRLADTTIKEVE